MGKKMSRFESKKKKKRNPGEKTQTKQTMKNKPWETREKKEKKEEEFCRRCGSILPLTLYSQEGTAFIRSSHVGCHTCI